MACHTSDHRCLTGKRRPRAEPHNTIWAESERFATARCWPVPGSALRHAARAKSVAFFFFELPTSRHMWGGRLCLMPKVGSLWTSSVTSMLSQVLALVGGSSTSYRQRRVFLRVMMLFSTVSVHHSSTTASVPSSKSADAANVSLLVLHLFVFCSCSSQRQVPVHDARIYPFTSCASASGGPAVLRCLVPALLPSSPPADPSFLNCSLQENQNLEVTR